MKWTYAVLIISNFLLSFSNGQIINPPSVQPAPASNITVPQVVQVSPAIVVPPVLPVANSSMPQGRALTIAPPILQLPSQPPVQNVVLPSVAVPLLPLQTNTVSSPLIPLQTTAISSPLLPVQTNAIAAPLLPVQSNAIAVQPAVVPQKVQNNIVLQPAAPEPSCVCGVFLSGQFIKGSNQQPVGNPALLHEQGDRFPCNAMGNKQCVNKCLDLLVKHLPNSPTIICGSMERDCYKERAYLWIKNCNTPWINTNLSAGREYCCKDGIPYKCPLVS